MIVPTSRPSRHTPEAWKDIPGTPGYTVSCRGRVRSYLNLGRHVGGRAAIGSAPKLLKGSPARGYGHVILYGGPKHRCARRAVLVLEAFVGPRPPGMHACHNDGNPGNNHLENLRWDTQSGNFKDKMRHGTLRCAKLTEADIPGLWARLVAGEQSSRIGRDYGITPPSVAAIKMGRCWSHITQHLPGWPIVTPLAAATRLPIRAVAELAASAAEIWRPFPGASGYRVSIFGRIATQWEVERAGGKSSAFLSGRWRELDLKLNAGDEYIKFWLRSEAGRCRMQSVHSAVLLTFAGPRPTRCVVCHDDGNPMNNHVNNLRWDTHTANRMDYLRHHTKTGGAV